MAYEFITYTGDEDIEGEDYQRFIDICSQYSSYFSLVYEKPSKYITELEKYIVYSKFTHTWPGTTTSEIGRYIVYQLNETTKRILKSSVDSLFSWIPWGGMCNPEDLTFYREDKSIFFYATCHEGDCNFLNKSTEDINEFLSKYEWREFKSQYEIIGTYPDSQTLTFDDYTNKEKFH